jgi:hypothetical protein
VYLYREYLEGSLPVSCMYIQHAAFKLPQRDALAGRKREINSEEEISLVQ